LAAFVNVAVLEGVAAAARYLRDGNPQPAIAFLEAFDLRQ